MKPPYSRMTAYNLNTGTIAWQVPTGPGQDGIRNHPALAGLKLPELGGQGGLGGPLVTEDAADLRVAVVAGRADAAAGSSRTTRRPARWWVRCRCPARRSARR